MHETCVGLRKGRKGGHYESVGVHMSKSFQVYLFLKAPMTEVHVHVAPRLFQQNPARATMPIKHQPKQYSWEGL